MKPTQQQEKLKKQSILSAITITSMEYHTDIHTSELKVRIFSRRTMVDQARQGLCYQRET